MSLDPPDNEIDEVLVFGKVKVRRADYIDFVAKYQGDPEYRAWVEQNPAQALRSEGFEIPDGVEINLLESADDRLHVVVPDSAIQ